MAKIVSQIVLVVISFGLIKGDSITAKHLYRPFGPKRCVELCQQSDTPVLFMRQYHCRRIPASRKNEGNNIHEDLFTCVNKGDDDEAKRRCLLATVKPQMRPKGSGAHGGPCVDESTCHFPDAKCHEGLCHCEVGKYFDPKTNTCVDKCKVYDEEMTFFYLKSIKYHNDAHIKNVSLDDCFKHCKCETSFVCLTAEYRKSNKDCHLSKTGFGDVPFKFQDFLNLGLGLVHRTRCK